jgi:hypothetical protein
MIFNGLDLFRNLPAARQWGFQTYTANQANRYPYVGEVDAAAQRAGLRRGDRFVSIGGEPIPAGETEFGIARRLDAIQGSRLALASTSANGQSVSVHALQRLPDRWSLPEIRTGMPLWLFSIVSYVSVQLIPLLLLSAAVVLYMRRPADPEALLFGIGFTLLANESSVDFWLLSLLGIAPATFPALVGAGQCAVIIAAAGFPGARYGTRLSRTVALAVVPAIATRYLTTQFAPEVSWLATAIVGLVLLGAAASIVQRFRMLPAGLERQQIKWVVLGFCITAAATLLIAQLPQYNAAEVRGNAAYYVFYQVLRLVGFVALPLGLLISLLRYRLYDAERTISRSAVYAALSVALIGVFAATERTIEVVGEEFFGGAAGAVAGAMGAAMVAVAIAPLHRRFDQWAKRYFQKALVALAEKLPVTMGDLREVASPQQIAGAAAAQIASALHTTRVSIVHDGETLADIADEPGALARQAEEAGIGPSPDRAEFALRLPIGLEPDDPAGWLLLGPRPDGSRFSKEERAVVADVADHLGRAIEIARQRTLAQQAQFGIVAGLAARLEAVEAQLRGIAKPVAARKITPG